MKVYKLKESYIFLSTDAFILGNILLAMMHCLSWILNYS